MVHRNQKKSKYDQICARLFDSPAAADLEAAASSLTGAASEVAVEEDRRPDPTDRPRSRRYGMRRHHASDIRSFLTQHAGEH